MLTAELYVNGRQIERITIQNVAEERLTDMDGEPHTLYAWEVVREPDWEPKKGQVWHKRSRGVGKLLRLVLAEHGRRHAAR